jgi:hypothetical protein
VRIVKGTFQTLRYSERSEEPEGINKKNRRKMKEKTIVLEWTPIEGKAAAALQSFVFTDRKEVRR